MVIVIGFFAGDLLRLFDTGLACIFDVFIGLDAPDRDFKAEIPRITCASLCFKGSALDAIEAVASRDGVVPASKLKLAKSPFEENFCSDRIELLSSVATSFSFGGVQSVRRGTAFSIRTSSNVVPQAMVGSKGASEWPLYLFEERVDVASAGASCSVELASRKVPDWIACLHSFFSCGTNRGLFPSEGVLLNRSLAGDLRGRFSAPGFRHNSDFALLRPGPDPSRVA